MARYILFSLALILCSACSNTMIETKASEQMEQVTMGEHILYEDYILPKFKEGDLNQWLSQNLKYPKEAVDLCLEGRTIVQFTVKKDGTITDAKIARSVHPLLDEEVLRVINLMPAWKPARTLNGEIVRSRYTLPIVFDLGHETDSVKTSELKTDSVKPSEIKTDSLRLSK